MNPTMFVHMYDYECNVCACDWLYSIETNLHISFPSLQWPWRTRRKLPIYSKKERDCSQSVHYIEGFLISEGVTTTAAGSLRYLLHHYYQVTINNSVLNRLNNTTNYADQTTHSPYADHRSSEYSHFGSWAQPSKLLRNRGILKPF